MDLNGLRDFYEFKGIVREFRGAQGIFGYFKEFYGILRNIVGFEKLLWYFNNKLKPYKAF